MNVVKLILHNSPREKLRQPPRPSFYTWTVPPELPSGEAAPPNRVDHEEKQMTMLRFMNKIQDDSGKPRKKTNGFEILFFCHVTLVHCPVAFWKFA